MSASKPLHAITASARLAAFPCRAHLQSSNICTDPCCRAQKQHIQCNRVSDMCCSTPGVHMRARGWQAPGSAGGAPQRTDAGHEVHVCVGVGEAEPAALHRRPRRRLAALRSRGHIHSELAPHEVRAVQLAGLLGRCLRPKLHKAVAVQLPCAAQRPCLRLRTGGQPLLRAARMTVVGQRSALDPTLWRQQPPGSDQVQSPVADA